MPPKLAVDTYSNWDLIRDLWRWLGKYRAQFVWASLIALLAEAAWLYPAYALAKIVNLFTTYGRLVSREELSSIVLIWIGLAAFRFFGRQWSQYMTEKIGERLTLDIIFETVRHMIQLDLSWQEQENTGNKMQRIHRGSGAVQAILRMWNSTLLPGSVAFVGSISIVATVNRPIGIWLGIFIVSYYWLSSVLIKRAVLAMNAVNQSEEDAGGLAYEAVGNIRTVKVLGFGNSIMRRVARLNDSLFQNIVVRMNHYMTRDLAVNGWGQVFRMSMLIYVIKGILDGNFEAGFLILIYSYHDRIWMSVGQISDLDQQYTMFRQAIGRMGVILKEPLGIEAAGTKNFPKHWQSIQLKDVSFGYGDDKVLKRLSFTVKRGERLGVVGLSGAGKSTLFKLLLKEYEDYTGEILVDGIPFREIKRSSFVEHAAVVLQETEVFNFSLKENITIANNRKARDTKLLEQTLKIAHVTDFVGRMPQGIETLIGEKGVKLSGGEKQRVGIARAVFKQPDLLLLDEATSHLDSESEQKIQDSLHQVFKSVTAVVIAHRLSTIREMDRILVLEGGKLIEEGSFDELLKKKGRFAELWQTQQF